MPSVTSGCILQYGRVHPKLIPSSEALTIVTPLRFEWTVPASTIFSIGTNEMRSGCLPCHPLGLSFLLALEENMKGSNVWRALQRHAEALLDQSGAFENIRSVA